MITDTRSRNCPSAGVPPTHTAGRLGRLKAERGTMGLEEIDLIDGRNFVAGVPHEWFRRLRAEA